METEKCIFSIEFDIVHLPEEYIFDRNSAMKHLISGATAFMLKSEIVFLNSKLQK